MRKGKHIVMAQRILEEVISYCKSVSLAFLTLYTILVGMNVINQGDFHIDFCCGCSQSSDEDIPLLASGLKAGTQIATLQVNETKIRQIILCHRTYDTHIAASLFLHDSLGSVP